MERWLTPAEVIKALIGPETIVAEIVGRDRTTVIKWRWESGRRRAGDLPGTEEMRTLLTHARAHDIPLTPEHLIFGADAAEIEALLAQRKVAAE